MVKVKYIEHSHHGEVYHKQYEYMCLGCGYTHCISPDVHQFNGDLDKPTFRPSLLQSWMPDKVCHSFIKDGMIQYLDDCWHELKNQTIELPDIEEEA